MAAGVFIDVEPELAVGEYDFTAVFGAVGEAEEPPPATGKIHGSKFHDMDADAVWDPDEPGLPDFTIVLDIGDDGTGDRFTQTNSTGDYWFMDVPAGHFRVWESPPPGWVHTHPIVGSYTGDLASGQVITGLDFGNMREVPPGRIVFDSDRDGNREIYVMNADGTNQTKLTNDPAYDDCCATLSPNGERIAFQTNRDGNWEIYVMNADGTGQTNITNNAFLDGTQAWSPDGTKIAFRSYRTGGSDIYVMDTDGSSPTRLTNNPANDLHPDWSPDGTKIAFISTRDGLNEIYVMNSTDGSGQTSLTNDPGAHDGDPDWSPDGSKIAFYSTRDADDVEIYVMNADGTGQTRLTDSPGADYNPSWSPDGGWIAFFSDRDDNLEIYVMNADGTGQTNITDNPAADRAPDWGVVGVGLP